MQPEFSRIIDIDVLNSSEINKKLEATSLECEALARRLQVIAIDNLVAEVNLQKQANGDILVTGNFVAGVEMTSVISLESFKENIADSFETIFTRHPIAEPTELEDFSLDIEQLEGDEIDVGELIAEYLALAIPPFPKKQGEEFNHHNQEKVAENTKVSPFSALKNLN